MNNKPIQSDIKILWVNPSFLDYRIPVYKRLFELTNGNFHLIYSKSRVPERINAKILKAIGKNAIGLANEKTFEISSKGDFANKSYRIPFQPGLSKEIAKIDADIIIGEGFFQWTPAALFRAKLKKKKFVIAYERTAHTERNCPRWRKSYRKLINRFVNGYLVNGKLTKDYLLQLGVKEKQIHIGGMSADTHHLLESLNSYPETDLDKLRKNLQENNGLVFLFVGQINERKGISQLLNGWKAHHMQFPQDKLIAIGTGPLLQSLQSMYEKDVSIMLLGDVAYDTIFQYYASADVFIMPTLEDNWSLVVPEAMAFGLPIACSIYNGCYPELVQEGINGQLFDPLDSNSILKTLETFHTVDLKSFGENSKKIERLYNSESVATKIFYSCQNMLE